MPDSTKNIVEVLRRLKLAEIDQRALARTLDDAMADKLTQSMRALRIAADMAELPRVASLAEAGLHAIAGMDDADLAPMTVAGLQKCLSRIRKILLGVGMGFGPPGGIDSSLVRVLNAIGDAAQEAHAIASEEAVAQELRRFALPLRPEPIPVTDEAIEAARQELQISREKALDAVALHASNELAVGVAKLAAVVTEYPMAASDLTPLSAAWSGTRAMVAGLSIETGNAIQFEAMGDDIDVEHRLLAALSDAIAASMRNVVRGSLDSKTARRASGKADEARVTLSALCDHHGLSITIMDDGKGDEASFDIASIQEHLSPIGGAVQVVAVPQWGSSLTLAVPASELGAWRLRVEPRRDVERPTKSLERFNGKSSDKSTAARLRVDYKGRVRLTRGR